ncbi:hypothetical protein DSM43518_03632 [Mycobacterium marinum]|nr:hypothetical protein CCUG20998_03267 [Mycobacterium marinum]RFZ07164.1 hypothetical protein DSM43518_03632 [Mycobacterium marinum]RFZ19804.1 hypothetical protein DSM43519_03778 [Mycobacterium marinum]RFZ30073.1 hypothetical protein DSM44344_00511 [Mycobacterium marinum]CDM77429.1 hypothetical protein MMARE11_32870 [Mycobacterium marinum E11]
MLPPCHKFHAWDTERLIAAARYWTNTADQ